MHQAVRDYVALESRCIAPADQADVRGLSVRWIRETRCPGEGMAGCQLARWMERSVIVIDVSLYNQTKFQKTEYYVPDLKASLDYVCPDDPVIGMTFTFKGL